MQSAPEPPKEPQTPSIEQPQAPAKPKKERSEAQKRATAKALAAMTARRKELNEKAKEKKEEVKKVKKMVEDKIIKEDLGFVTRQDHDQMKSMFMKEIAELKALHSPAVQEKTKKPAVQERIVERVIERPTTQINQPQKLTGHALLDKVFGFQN